MTLSALVVCTDEAAAQVLRRVLEELSIRAEFCPDFARAAIRLAQDRFDAVIAEAESNNEVIGLLRDTRMIRLNEATLAVAVVSGQEAIRELFSLGVNFVLYKPVAYDRALSSLRAARAVMRKEKRKSARASVYAHATVDYADVLQDKATLVDVAQDGMSVRFGKKIPSTGKVYFQFHLPGQSASVRLSGQLIWQEWSGRAGIQFVDVPKTSRRLLTDFLRANLPRTSKPAEENQVFPETQLRDVTVEMEEPLQAVGVAAGHETFGGEETASHSSSAAGAAEQPDSANRRAQTRYSCRLGAEVYRTGIPVPYHCCLTDLSAGGCYLEVLSPFPTGVSVEILVRTYEMKLRMRGTVLATHPGYGMGVSFELKTKEQRENVKKLTDFVAATTNPSN